MEEPLSHAATHRVDEHQMFQREERDVDAMVEPIAEEFRRGFQVVAQIDRPGVSIFGSARTAADAPWYTAARDAGRRFAEEGFAVVTGGGPGIMEAANRGARDAGGLSVGFNIVLPHEQSMNAFVDLGATFEHFYARKVMFVKAAEGFVVFPGGFGTMDELFEALTLIQTGKIRHFPVVLMGRDHWRAVLEWTRERVLGGGYVAQVDLDLVTVTDDPDEAVQTVVECYRDRCAHSGSGPQT
jgi:uncharacterized protein (TIGR00730 family)